jgi:carboxyl-terminal processing protease
MRSIALLLASTVIAIGLIAAEAPHAGVHAQAEPPVGGLGVEFILDGGSVKIVTSFDDGPAAKAGVVAGDVITHVDGAPMQNPDQQEVIGRLRGPVNTTVRLTIVRKGEDKPLELAVVREPFRFPAVRPRQVGDDIGYIRIAFINEQTLDELTKALGDLSSRIPADRLKGYILDLRNIRPGLLDPAVALADAFLKQGEIVSVRERGEEELRRIAAGPGDLSNGRPLVVLVNQWTAGMAEIVAAALQDHKRATIVGVPSFGDASVQTVIPLGPGSGAIRLTTGRAFTPAGRSFHRTGIVPDVVVVQDDPPSPDDDHVIAVAAKLLREGQPK